MKCFLSLLVFLPLSLPILSAESMRIATYNIRFLNYDELAPGRKEQLIKLIQQLNADIFALQEIQDRKVLETIFPKSKWQIVIDDESEDKQDLALVVSKRFILDKKPDDKGRWNADDPDFLFPAPEPSEEDELFPRRRDLLRIALTAPESKQRFWVLVHHAKSRVGGRATTTARRIGASRAILAKLQREFADQAVVLLGDFNDTPDDASLNILESGNPAAEAAMENEPGPFLFNLVEPLWAQEMVSFDWERGKTGLKIAIPGARLYQFTERNSNDYKKQVIKAVLFDNILVNEKMKAYYKPHSTTIFAGLAADEPASDHLPIYADFLFPSQSVGKTAGKAGMAPKDPEPARLVIAALLVNPNGSDEGKEEVVLRNQSEEVIDLSGWLLRDRSGKSFAPLGKIPPGKEKVLRLKKHELPLANQGDELELLDPAGQRVDQASYEKGQVHEGEHLRFHN